MWEEENWEAKERAHFNDTKGGRLLMLETASVSCVYFFLNIVILTTTILTPLKCANRLLHLRFLWFFMLCLYTAHAALHESCDYFFHRGPVEHVPRKNNYDHRN